MSSTTAPTLNRPARAPAAARCVLRLLKRLHAGTLDVQLPDGSLARFGSNAGCSAGAGAGAGAETEPRASMRWLDWRVCADVLKAGDIGLAEAFIAGRWSSPDLVALLKLFMHNRAALEAVVYGSWWGSLMHRVRHLLNRNSRQGSRKNVQAHYDIGNAFYGLWLDETMNYSSALFDGDAKQPLAQAQQAKLRRALAECALAPGERLLEIGCGWGALAEVAAREFELQVHGVTLSPAQLAYAQERLARQGLHASAELRLQDYRELRHAHGAHRFDAVVSIEMFEAVGHAYWGEFFKTVHACLKPGGRACIQTITIRDDLFARYLKSTDFVQQYIFPGGLLPSPQAFRAEATKAGFTLVGELAFGADYAETLQRWRVQFLAHDAQVRQLGMDARFMRIWEFYLAYCEAAFASGNTDVMQFTLQR